MDTSNIWNNFLAVIRDKMSTLSYDTWFSSTKLLSLENKTAKVVVPTIVHKKHLSVNYLSLIEETFNQITGTIFKIEFLLDNEEEETTTVEIGVPNNNLKNNNLKENYTFSSFIVGDSNKFAHAASVSVAENPGKVYNPLFIYGNSGLGKTHLMHAIGNYIIKNTNKTVLYVTSENFIADFSDINKREAGKNNFSAIEFFKNKYRNIDVLIIDDIQFLASATQTQSEFFHTFNKLYDDDKQIIISSDKSIDDLKLLEERLRTRFSWGLTVCIEKPELMLRCEILKSKIKSNNLILDFSDEVVTFIAENLTNDIRQLEGAVNRVLAYATMFNKPIIDIETVSEALRDNIIKSNSDGSSVQKIMRLVSEYYNVSIDEIKGKKRTKNIAYPRQIAMFLCRELTDETITKIGIYFGGKDHSTVLHAHSKIKKEEFVDKNVEIVIKTLTSRFKD